MLHDVVSAVYRGDYLIEIEFDDDQRGIVDFSKYLERRGVFERFRDIEFFRNFVVNKELGILTWNNEIDIAPKCGGYRDRPSSMDESEKRFSGEQVLAGGLGASAVKGNGE